MTVTLAERFSSPDSAVAIASARSGSLGWGGKPPRPVMINSLFSRAKLSSLAEQSCAISLELSTTVGGKLTNPLVGLVSSVLICTVPLIPNSELAVISLSGVNLVRDSIPKMPCAAISILPPRPSKALAVISLFSKATRVLVSIVMLPPVLLPPAVALI